MFFSLKSANSGYFIKRFSGGHPVRILPSWELIAVVSGSLQMFEEKNDFSLFAGDFLLLRPDRKHGGIGNYGNDLKFYWVHFYLDEKNELPVSGPLCNPDKVFDIFRILLQDQSESPSCTQNRDLLVQLLLNECCRIPENADPDSPALVRSTLRLIRSRACEPGFCTHTISNAIGCGADHLNRIFKKHTGYTLTGYINYLRIKRAQELLCGSNLSVKEIMFLCGISDSAWFFRIFRRSCGMTPAKFREFHSREHINFK